MATAKDMRSAVSRAVDKAIQAYPEDKAMQARMFAAYLCGTLAAMEERALEADLNRLLGLSPTCSTDGA